ncbi:Protein of unknwon function (DUF3310) [uncultured Mediterranean phage uvMED]|nr:Protein of unknwon function (DUF3310) [uncultured Mediterranean phage uvMED]BAR22596.1 Protein of unknown function (DUF3310) [uncultured Mediterranean phage uvMED]
MKEETKNGGYDFIKPPHYQIGPLETWDAMGRIWGKEKLIAFCEMNAFKYRMRLGSKPGEPIERDLKKAQLYEAKAARLKESYKNFYKNNVSQQRKLLITFLEMNNWLSLEDEENAKGVIDCYLKAIN